MTWRLASVEPLDGVHRAEHLGDAGAGGVEVEADLLAVAEHAVRRQRQAVAVDLEAVAQPRLHDALVAVDLVDQAVDVGHQLDGDVADVAGDDGAEQQPAEPRRRVDRQHEVAEGEAPRRRERPGVPHLELGEEHDPHGIGERLSRVFRGIRVSHAAQLRLRHSDGVKHSDGPDSDVLADEGAQRPGRRR